MDKRLYFELMVELSHKDTWVHYYFVYYKTFVIFGTGLPIFASSILIYKELGWKSLAERRKRRKLQMFYNIQNTHTSQAYSKIGLIKTKYNFSRFFRERLYFNFRRTFRCL
jgi:hypothetical protein